MSDEIQKTLLTIPGAAQVSGEQITGQPALQIVVNQDQIARHGIPTRNVLEVIEAVGVRRDVASFVAEAQARLEKEVNLPEGYIIEWGGQFEHLIRSQRRFMIVVPLALIFFLLYLSLRSLHDVLIIYTGIPFAAIGGALALWALGISFSVSAAIGFIALSGIAMLNGQALVAAIRNFCDEGLPLAEAVISAAKQRLRPALATAINDAAGFIPMAISTGVGAEVKRPLATVVVFGVITSTLLILVVLPAVYLA